MPRVIDLSMPLCEGMPMLSMLSPFRIQHTSSVERDGFEVTEVSMNGHTGTHIDAPLHFIVGGSTIEKIDCDSVFAEARVFDLSHLPPRSQITREILENCQIDLPRGSAALIYSGSEKLLGKPEYFTDYPYFTRGAAEWLIGKGVTLVGMDMVSADTLSVEPLTFEGHKALLGAGVHIVESLVNLEELLKGGRFLFAAFPLRIVGAEASPVRAVAIKLE